MRTVQGRTFESLRAVQDFLDATGAVLATVNASGARIKLDQIVAELETHATEQAASTLEARGAINQRIALRRTLVKYHLAAVARIARAALPTSPALESFRVPRGKPTPARLAQTAHGMAAAAEPYEVLFVTFGLPANFREALTQAADAMLATVDATKQRRGARVGATRGIAATLTAGRKLVHILDAFVQPVLERDPALLANWNVVKRVQRVGVRHPSSPAGVASTESGSPQAAQVAAD